MAGAGARAACWLLALAPALVLPAPTPVSPATPFVGESAEAAGGWPGGLPAALPVLAVLAALAGLVFSCAWCHRYKFFSASQSSLQDVPEARAQPPAPVPGAREEPPQPARGPVFLVRAPEERLNNNVHEDNNNGPISIREMQNIENNNAAVYIVSENENRNAVQAGAARLDAVAARLDAGAARLDASRESVVEFEPLPDNITPARRPDYRFAEWCTPPQEDFPRNRLQYLREIGRGSFGRIVEGEMEPVPDVEGNTGPVKSVAVKIINQNASSVDKSKFLMEARLFRDVNHENVLSLLARNLSEDPWLLVFELCSMDLQQYLVSNRPKMAALNERGVPLRIKCDIAAGLSYVHSQGRIYGSVWSGGVLVHDVGEEVQARLGFYNDARPRQAPRWTAPELLQYPTLEENGPSEVWSLGVLLWEVCSWGATPYEQLSDERVRSLAVKGALDALRLAPPLPCPYRDHLYQVMQLCWNTRPECRPSVQQVHALLNHLYTSHTTRKEGQQAQDDDGYNSSDFEERWQRLKPNTIPKIDEHVVIVHTAHPMSSRFTCSDEDFRESRSSHLSVDPDAVVSRSSSIMSDKELMHLKSDSLTNLHGSFEDVRNVNYLGFSDGTILESHLESTIEKTINVANTQRDCEDLAEKVDPWLKDIIAESQDDVSFYKDVSDVIKNLDNILNSEKTSSSESSHQASPSRDNLVLHCKGEYPVQSSLVKSPGISNFQSILEVTPEHKPKESQNDDLDRVKVGALHHSYKRNCEILSPQIDARSVTDFDVLKQTAVVNNSESLVPTLVDLCIARTNNSVSSCKDLVESESKDCQESCDNDNLFKHSSEKIVTEMFEPMDTEENVTEIKTLQETSPEELCLQVTFLESEAKVYELLESNNSKLEESSSAIEILLKEEDDTNKNSLSDTDVLSIDNDSTVYMDLKTSSTETPNMKEFTNSLDKGIEKDVTKLCDELKDTAILSIEERSYMGMDTTEYLDLPSVLGDTTAFLHAERTYLDTWGKLDKEVSFKSPPNNLDVRLNVITSTPKVVEDIEKAMLIQNIKGAEASEFHIETEIFSEKVPTSELQAECNISETAETKNESVAEVMPDLISNAIAPDYGPHAIITKLEQQTASEDLVQNQEIEIDEECSVVLGPFENCSLDFFTGIKTNGYVQNDNFSKEELLAFSSDFTDFNLECGIIREERDLSELNKNQFEIKPEVQIDDSEMLKTSELAQSHSNDSIKPSFSPTTPPNSPGNLLGSPQHKYLIHRYSGAPNLAADPAEPVDINHIEIQFTTKMAMAENENNMNIEYSGPLSLEELPAPEHLELTDMDDIDVDTPPECNDAAVVEYPKQLLDEMRYGSTESLQQGYTDVFLDEECVKALRSELELKLPLAQASVCEPMEENLAELPPPPDDNSEESGRDEIIVCYPGALSPIAEETRQQLSAYENNLYWSSHRTDSSESYPEPCNNSTDDITDLLTAMRSCQRDNDTLNNCENNSQDSPVDNTYTIHKDGEISKEMSMSADSLNGSDDGTLKDILMPSTSVKINETASLRLNEIESPLYADERISQISPFILSPLTETCKIQSESNEYFSNVSKLSKPTLPSDIKSSKASDTQCLSKATSIDSWCSNDTLFNIEDNFDEPGIDSEDTSNIIPNLDGNSQVKPNKEEISHSSGTLTQDEDDSKHGSTYIIQDNKSDKCDSFTPDSITSNNNYTYTKVKTENPANSPSKIYSAKNTFTNDVASGTPLSSAICNSTDTLSTKDYMAVEQMRRSPIDVIDLNITPLDLIEVIAKVDDSACYDLKSIPVMVKMDSVDIACLKEGLIEITVDNKGLEESLNIELMMSPEQHYRCMANSVTSTPIVTEVKNDQIYTPPIQAIKLPQENFENVPDFNTFVNSAELRPQDMSLSTNDDNTSLLKETKHDQDCVNTERKPQGVSPIKIGLHANITPNLSDGIGSSVDFLQFERSAQERPQDLVSVKKVDSNIKMIDTPEIAPASGSSAFAANSHNGVEENKSECCKDNNDVAMCVLLNENKAIRKSCEVGQDLTAQPIVNKDLIISNEEEIESSGANISLTELRKGSDVAETLSVNVSLEHKKEFLTGNNSIPVFEENTDSSTVDSFATIFTQLRTSASPAIDSTINGEHTEIQVPDDTGLRIRNDCSSFCDFESSAARKAQELSSFTSHNSTTDHSTRKDLTNSTPEFLSFEKSVLRRPQDLSSLSKSTDESLHISQNSNETFETYDSHGSRRNPQINSETTQTSDSSNNMSRDKNENVENLNDSTDPIRKTKLEYNASDYKLSSLFDAFSAGCNVMSNGTHQASTAIILDNIEIVKPNILNSTNVNIVRNDEEHHSIIAIAGDSNGTEEVSELVENEKDSLVSAAYEITQSDTIPDKEVSSTMSIEESEPTTREMDSLDNYLEIVNEEVLVHNTLSTHEKLVKEEIKSAKIRNEQGISTQIKENTSSPTIIENVMTSTNEDSTTSICPDLCNGKQSRIGNVDASTVDLCSLTNNFIEMEKTFSGIDVYLPLLNDIRFTGPSSDYMSTSFSQDSPTEDASMIMLDAELKKAERNCEKLGGGAVDALKEWESESEDSQTNSTSSGEFIWKDGEGLEKHVTPSTDFDDHHQNGGGGGCEELGSIAEGSEGEGEGEGEEEGSASGSEGDEVEFVPSSWDCDAAPARSALKSAELNSIVDGKKRVVFKRQKYHCVYEYPREAADYDCEALHSPFLPDYSTYSDWDVLGAGEADNVEMNYGDYVGAPLHLYRLPGTDGSYSPNFGLPDEDFFISSSARPFESLGIMSTTSQFFPGMHATLKAVSCLDRPESPVDDGSYDFPPPPSPLASVTVLPETKMNHLGSLDLTTPDSGVEDVTPGSTLDDDLKEKLRAEVEKNVTAQSPVKPDRSFLKLGPTESSASSSESQSPSSPCWEALGGLRHTRDRLKLDLPPSPLHVSSPSRHSQKVFNFLTVDPPKVKKEVTDIDLEDSKEVEIGQTPLVMTEETPVVTALPIPENDDITIPEPTFSTFGKSVNRSMSSERKPIVLSDESRSESIEQVEVQNEEFVKPLDVKNKPLPEAVKGEGTVLDSGDEDSGIESSAKTTLERNTTSANVQ